MRCRRNPQALQARYPECLLSGALIGVSVATPNPLGMDIGKEGSGHPLICPSVWKKKKKRKMEVAMTKKEEGRRSSHPPIPQGRIMPRREVAIPSIH